jgi:catecholate siderophore receptor
MSQSVKVFWLAGAGALALAGAIFPATPVRAETDAEADVQVLEGVVVTGRREGYGVPSTTTATRTETALKETPQSVTVVTDELIDDQAMQGMADVLRYVPGATMAQGEGHRDAPVLRGNASTADFFVDGVRDDVQYFRDLYNLDRVEVLKGPNAMIFGRGGGGGVINRVTKRAHGGPSAELRLEAGAYAHARLTGDLNLQLAPSVYGRLNALYQRSDSFRDQVELERWGVNPTLTIQPSERLAVRLGYERFEDDRTVDRGVPAFRGRPATPSRSTFFGDPGQSYSTATVDFASAAIDYALTPTLTLRNRTVVAGYDKFYQNVYPGAVNAAGDRVSILAYNNLTRRENLFNQTDLIFQLDAGGLQHTLLAGVEFGRQDTENVRVTGFFNNTATSILVPFARPTLSGTPVTFRPAPGDANHSTEAAVAAAYLQDQLRLTDRLQLIAGLRFDRFDLDSRDNRTGADLSRTDELVSPRVGIVYEPVEPLSLYASYSVSHLPASGDQFSSLSPGTATLEPEEFENLEVGAKWALRDGLMLTAAVYRLDRTNTTARDPAAPERLVQTGSQRTTGFELELVGRLASAWQVQGGYAFQDAEITSATTAAPAGRKVPLSPRHAFSLWNKVELTPAWSAGLGVVWQDEAFASISNAVAMPSFTRVDAALFYRLSDRVQVQLNAENLLDETYFPTAHSDNNITPGGPRSLRVALTTRF